MMYYSTVLVRAEDGRKMSKSLGNGVDPMDVIDGMAIVYVTFSNRIFTRS